MPVSWPPLQEPSISDRTNLFAPTKNEENVYRLAMNIPRIRHRAVPLPTFWVYSATSGEMKCKVRRRTSSPQSTPSSIAGNPCTRQFSIRITAARKSPATNQRRGTAKSVISCEKQGVKQKPNLATSTLQCQMSLGSARKWHMGMSGVPGDPPPLAVPTHTYPRFFQLTYVFGRRTAHMKIMQKDGRERP